MKITKSQIQGLVATLAVHVVVVVLLMLLAMRAPLQEPESGIPVMLGNAELAQGHTESYQFTEVMYTCIQLYKNTHPLSKGEPRYA